MKILVFTSGRQDWNILEPVARAIRSHPGMELALVASGGHFRGGGCPTHLGGIPVDDRIDTLQAGDTDVAVAQTAGWTTALLAGCLQRLSPDAVLVVGDRTETMAVALAAVCMKVPLVHLHGGEETEGAIDNLCRHAISKLASLHFVAHPAFAERLFRMGEPPDRVFIAGAPGLDQVNFRTPGSREELARALGREELGRPLVVFTHHPTTLGGLEPVEEVRVVLEGLGQVIDRIPGLQVIMTHANTDAGGQIFNTAMATFAKAFENRVVFVPTLGPWYFTLLNHADAMAGNSSSGILEAATFGLPVVDIGDRQAGRMRGPNVLHAPLDAGAIASTLVQALEPPFKEGLAGRANPYGDGQAAKRIVADLWRFAEDLGPAFLKKSFHLYPAEAGQAESRSELREDG